MVTLSKWHGLSLALFDYLIVCFVFSRRVHAISVAMDLVPVLWTQPSPTVTFDTGGIHFYFTFIR